MGKEILHIITQFTHDGVTSYATRLIRNLPDFDHTILSCYKGNTFESIKERYPSVNYLLDEQSISTKHMLRKYIGMIFFLRKNHFDIIHYHQGGVGIILLAVLFGKKAKVIHHLHSGNLIGDNTKQDIPILHRSLLRWLSKRTIQVAVAEHVFNQYEKEMSCTQNLHLIKNAVPFDFKPRKELKKSIGFIGRFTEEKGFCRFVKLISEINKQIPDLSFIVMGEEVEKVGNKIVNEVNNLTIKAPTYRVEEFYNRVDLILFLSKAPEGLPLVVLEALSFDVGVITFPLKGTIEILGEHYPLIINDESDVNKIIIDYFTGKINLQELSSIHEQRYSNFNPEKMTEDIRSLYIKAPDQD